MTEQDFKSIKAINLEIARIQKARQLLNCSQGSEKAKSDYKRLLQENEDELLGKKVEIETLINNIPDAEIRLIFKLKFVDMRSWNYIARLTHYDRSTIFKKYKKFVGGIK